MDNNNSMQTKFKVGDKVFVKNDLIVDKIYNRYYFNSEMSQLLGKEVTITDEVEDFYGKTAYAINLAIQAMIAGKDVLIDFYTLEMPETIMFKRFLTRVEKINGMRMRNMYKNLTVEEKVIIEERANKFLSTGLEIYDDRTTLRDIEVQIRRRHYEADRKSVV